MKNPTTILCFVMFFFIGLSVSGQDISTFDSICSHSTVRNSQGDLLAWYQPDIPGAAYDRVSDLASEFMLKVPIEQKTGEKMYFVTCCFLGFNLEPKEIVAEDWMHNPICVFAGSVQSFAVKYYQYTGDERYLTMVKEMLDYQLEHGTTPEGWVWEKVPYASADPFETEYKGAARWQNDGMRGDGLHGIEPDKVGEMGVAYLSFYKIINEQKYLEAALNCADALAKHVRDVVPGNTPFVTVQTVQSPWPFRVNAENGNVVSEYTSNLTETVKLFDELIRLKRDLKLDAEQVDQYTKARKIAWDWLYSLSGPMKTMIWSQYFEDIPNDETRSNRNQVSPMEWAKYLIENPELDKRMEVNIPMLIYWVLNTFGDEGISAIKEQTWCYESMGSHSARYGSTCAMWYEHTGDEWFKEQAAHNLNYATYMTQDNGVVSVGHRWKSSWFSDGYGDYVRHFIDAMAAIPEWAPQDENHLLKSSSIIKSINYEDQKISYQAFDQSGMEKFRLISKPSFVKVGGKRISSNDFSWQKLDKGGVLSLSRTTGNQVEIVFW